jgi:hypothetical protein
VADLSITAANVAAVTVSKQEWTAGATITAGQAVYLDSANSNVAKLAQSDGTSAEAEVKGIALCGAASGQPIIIASSGTMDLGATLTVGMIYVLSQTAGGIAPVSDLASSDYVSVIGVATATDEIRLSITNSGVEKP